MTIQCADDFSVLDVCAVDKKRMEMKGGCMDIITSGMFSRDDVDLSHIIMELLDLAEDKAEGFVFGWMMSCMYWSHNPDDFFRNVMVQSVMETIGQRLYREYERNRDGEQGDGAGGNPANGQA